MATPKMDDERFGELLLRMSEMDCRRLGEQAAKGPAASIAVWMAEELRRQSQDLRLSDAMTHRMREAARSLQSASAEVRRRRSAGRRLDHDPRPWEGTNGSSNGQNSH